ncbi:MAG: STAS domain-containing protein [Proteobacteria bacterium]|nr:STAS domain-containing protein [Pseudomonadota bacterium]MDP2105676.1 STAS domain-containing protein [Desulfobulbaceae bacterium]
MIDGTTSPYRVTVPMTYETAAELLERGRPLFSGEPIAFDLAAVPDVDSSALSIILGWQRAAGQGKLTITNLPKNISSLAALYGIDDFMAQ